MNAPDHPSNRVTEENVRNVLSYHKPTVEGLAKMDRVNAAAEIFIRAVLAEAPTCADRSAAIREVRIAKMFALAAISLDPTNYVGS